MKHYTFRISDFENEGDLDWARQYVKENFPLVKNIKTYQERDYEAEADYEDEYGECDEPIYQGYIEFDAPEEYRDTLETLRL